MRPMRMGDIMQINQIDREAYSDSWSPSIYRRDLLFNRLARYIVLYDASETPPQPLEEDTKRRGLLSRVRRLLNRDDAFTETTQNILGFAGLWFMVGEAHLTTIAVRERYRRKGLGELLLISATELSMARNAGILTLEVRASNTPAQALYEKYGFERVGVRRGYYTDNKEDAVLMSTDKLISASFQARFQRLKGEHAGRWGEAHLELGK